MSDAAAAVGVNLITLGKRGQAVCRFDRIDATRTALVVIDMQDAFVDPRYGVAAAGARDLIGRLNSLAAALRSAGGRVVFTRHTVSEEPRYALPLWLSGSPIMRELACLLAPGSPGYELHGLLDVHEGDFVLDKHRYSAFLCNSSTLDADLRAAGIDTVIITGTATNVCCESSARDAHMLDYKVFFPADANAAVTEEVHRATLLNIAGSFADTRSVKELLNVIKHSIAGGDSRARSPAS